MRYIVSINLAICILSSLLYAQLSELKIIGEPKNPIDEIVRVRDTNGRICAAIQVISDMDGFIYDAYNGVVKVDDRPGADMVYLQPGERVLKVYHKDYKPLKIILSDFGIQLNSKALWIIELKGEKSPILIPIVIITEPKDAKVWIDGIPVRQDSILWLRKGKYNIKISDKYYQTQEKEIRIEEKKNCSFKFKLINIYKKYEFVYGLGKCRSFENNLFNIANH